MASGYIKKPWNFATVLKQGRQSGDVAMPVKVLVANGETLETPRVITDKKELWLMSRANELKATGPHSERILWPHLEPMGFQMSVPMLGYIADFYHPDLKICIEVDGYHHQGRKSHDRTRDQAMRMAGISVYRFWAKTVYRELGRVVSEIKSIVEIRSPLDESPVPLLRRRRGRTRMDGREL